MRTTIKVVFLAAVLACVTVLAMRHWERAKNTIYSIQCDSRPVFAGEEWSVKGEFLSIERSGSTRLLKAEDCVIIPTRRGALNEPVPTP